MVDQFGTAEQRQKYLPDLVTMQVRLCLTPLLLPIASSVLLAFTSLVYVPSADLVSYSSLGDPLVCLITIIRNSPHTVSPSRAAEVVWLHLFILYSRHVSYVSYVSYVSCRHVSYVSCRQCVSTSRAMYSRFILSLSYIQIVHIRN